MRQPNSFKAMITNTFNSIGSNWFGGMFRKPLNATTRPTWRTYFADRRAPVLVDMENLFEVYQACPPLQLVINQRADMLSNGVFKVRNKKTKEVLETHWSYDLMKNPNPLQSQKEYIYEFGILSGIYSNSFVYRNCPFSGRPPATLWNLPPALMKIVPTGKLYDQTELKNIVAKYVLLGIEMKEFDTDEVKHTNTGVSKSPLLSDSRMIGLQLPISNIIGSLKTRNLFIYNGPKVIVSSAGRDDGGAIPLGETEQKRVENNFNKVKYGINDHQTHTMVTTASVTVDQISGPVKDMMLFEENEEDFAWMCGTYQMDRDLFPSVKGATKENKKEGLRGTQQTTIASDANAFCNFHDTLLNLEAEDVESFLDYDHLPFMQENEKERAEVNKIKVESITMLVEKGVMNPRQAQEMLKVITGIEIDDTLATTNVILNTLKDVSPLVATKLLDRLTVNQILGIFNLPPVAGGDAPPNTTTVKQDEPK